MPRYTRETVILAKLHASISTDPVPTGGSNAILCSKPNITPLQASNVSRDLVRAWLNKGEQLVGPEYVECSFDVEFVGSGTVATAPAWGPLVRACGMAETLTATVRADYTPITINPEALAIYWHDSGVRHILLAGRGTYAAKLKVGEIPVLSFTFTGLMGTVSATANASPTYTAFRTPQVVQDVITSQLVLGATHSATLAPAFTGGTTYPSQGIELDMGNAVSFTPLIGRESVDINDRAPMAKISLECTEAQYVALIGAVQAGTLMSVGMLHGSVANNKVGIWLPSGQLINPRKEDVNGLRLDAFDVVAVPGATGNDEVRLISSFA